MKRQYFEQIEQLHGEQISAACVIEQLAFDHRGLIPAITQDAASREVLMLAWMTKESLVQTLATGRVTYWSRSREQLWVKGETSGHSQKLVSVAFDCDGDSVLCLVEQTGAACHTGRKSCFYLNLDEPGRTVTVARD